MVRLDLLDRQEELAAQEQRVVLAAQEQLEQQVQPDLKVEQAALVGLEE